MRIERIDCLHADGGYTTFDFLKITTDTGLIGWSEYNESFGGIGVTAAIEALAPHLLGKDPRPVAAHLALMHALRRVVAGGIAHQAIAAIENALLDLKAKNLGIPVYALFGGPVRQTIRLYWSHCGFLRAAFAEPLGVPPVTSLDDIVACGHEVVSQGYDALKTNLLVFTGDGVEPINPGFARGPGYPERNAERLFRRALADQLAALREGAGDEADIMVDLNFNYRSEGFAAMVEAADPFDLAWVEIDGLTPEALNHLRRQGRTPIASGEALFGRRQYVPYIFPPAADVLIIDVPWNGLSEACRIAAMADAADINVAPHNFCGPLSTLINAHFAAIIPNLRIMEFDPDHVPWYDDLVDGPVHIEEGHLILPDGPGWGVQINEAAVAAHPPRPS